MSEGCNGMRDNPTLKKEGTAAGAEVRAPKDSVAWERSQGTTSNPPGGNAEKARTGSGRAALCAGSETSAASGKQERAPAAGMGRWEAGFSTETGNYHRGGWESKLRRQTPALMVDRRSSTLNI